jgi:mono/diheme cytochrome c family protein
MKFVLLTVLLFIAQFSIAQTHNSAQVARGKYLVQRVAMCGDCHTPRDDKGMPLPGKELAGAPLGFKPLAPMPWATTAPDIAGLPGWKDAQIVTFLTTGKLDGKAPNPPMPEYQLSAADARAVVAYLRTLGGAGATSQKSGATAK